MIAFYSIMVSIIPMKRCRLPDWVRKQGLEFHHNSSLKLKIIIFNLAWKLKVTKIAMDTQRMAGAITLNFKLYYLESYSNTNSIVFALKDTLLINRIELKTQT